MSATTDGYTLTGNATTTNNLAFSSANSFTAQYGTVLTVQGVFVNNVVNANTCLLDTSNAADDMRSVAVGGRHLIKKKLKISTDFLCAR